MPGSGVLRLRYSLTAMVLVALALRLIAVAFLYPVQLEPARNHMAFGWETGSTARAIAAGEGFSSPLPEGGGPSAWQPSVYTYLLAGMFKLFGIFSKRSALAILGLNSVFSAMTCVPIYLAVRKSFGGSVARWSGWTWALFPYAIYFSAARVTNVTLAALLLSLLFFATLRLREDTGWLAWAGYGLLWGINALTNPVALGVGPFVGGWLIYRLHRQGAMWGRSVAVSVLAFFIVISPWCLRNYVTFHQVIPLRDNFWLELHVGNAGDTSDVQADSTHPLNDRAEFQQFMSLGELKYMEAKKHQAIQWVEEHLGMFAWVSLRRFVYSWTGFWSLSHQFLAQEPFEIPNIGFATGISALMLWGVGTAWRTRDVAAIPYILLILSYPLVYYITHPSMDYRHPIDPLIIVLGAYPVEQWVERKKQVDGRMRAYDDQGLCQVSS